MKKLRPCHPMYSLDNY